MKHPVEFLMLGFMRYLQDENKCAPELDGKPCADASEGGLPQCGCLMELLSWCSKKDEPPKPRGSHLRPVP